VAKTHEKSMQKMLDAITKATEAYESLKKDLSLAKAGKPTQDGKKVSVDTCALSLSARDARLCFERAVNVNVGALRKEFSLAMVGKKLSLL
jgi:hypothetical protein